MIFASLLVECPTISTDFPVLVKSLHIFKLIPPADMTYATRPFPPFNFNPVEDEAPVLRLLGRISYYRKPQVSFIKYPGKHSGEHGIVAWNGTLSLVVAYYSCIKIQQETHRKTFTVFNCDVILFFYFRFLHLVDSPKKLHPFDIFAAQKSSM